MRQRKVGILDGFWHLLNFFAPALAVPALAATLAKLLWRGELRATSWRKMALWGFGASALVLVIGLVLTGADGRMATYGAMVLACGLALWWSGFGASRR